MNYKTTFCIAITFLAVVGATLFLVNEWNFNRDWASRVDEAVDQFTLKNGPGGVVGIVMDGELVYERAFGYADVDAKRLNSPRTLFDIASCTKQFTAACILELATQGKIDLHADVREYLPDLRMKKAVTVEQLLTHSSGIHDYSELMILARGRAGVGDFSRRETLDMIYRQSSLSFEPGEDENYSNSNYVLLGQLVEKMSGQTLIEYVGSHIFAPLEMQTARFGWPSRSSASMATPYPTRADKTGQFTSVPMSGNDEGLFGAGGIAASVRDMAKWIAHLAQAELSESRLYEQLAIRGTLPGGRQTEYGRGVVFGTTPDGHRWMEHTGRGSGGTSVVTWWPDVEIGFIVLTNTDELWAQALSDQFYSIVIASRPAPKEVVDWNRKTSVTLEQPPTSDDWEPISQSDITLSAEELDRFAGCYPADQPVGGRKPPSGGVGANRIERRGTELVATAFNGNDATLKPVGHDTLTLEVAGQDMPILLRFSHLGTDQPAVQIADPTDRNGQYSKPATRLPDLDVRTRESLAGRYQALDLVKAIPIEIAYDGDRIVMSWGIEKKSTELFFMGGNRLSTWSPGMQCNLLLSMNELGNVDGFTYEGHRVWHLPFSKL